jgi:hypothetical protein
MIFFKYIHVLIRKYRRIYTQNINNINYLVIVLNHNLYFLLLLVNIFHNWI